jgi:hypothetical protein
VIISINSRLEAVRVLILVDQDELELAAGSARGRSSFSSSRLHGLSVSKSSKSMQFVSHFLVLVELAQLQ